MVQQTLVGQGLLIFEASKSHSDTPHSVRVFWRSNQPNAETSTWQHTTLTRDTLLHRTTDCGPGKTIWKWTRTLLAMILNTRPQHISGDWAIRP